MDYNRGAAAGPSADSNKRQRVESVPSKVVHVRSLPQGVDTRELTPYFIQYGPVDYVLILNKFSQALVEFNNIDAAIAFVNNFRYSSLFIRGQPVQVQFSKSQNIDRAQADGTGAQQDSHNGEKILLITINKPLYPITVDVLFAILSPHGNVLRIVIFNKNEQLQALVEFDGAEGCQRAKIALDGRDIYDDCCTLAIRYSKNELLHVKYNNDHTKDFTNPSLPVGPDTRIDPEAPGGIMGPYGGGGFAQYQNPGMGRGGGRPGFGQPPFPMSMNPNQMAPNVGDKCVIMAYNMPSQMASCQRVFNLFCMYGNVMTVKMLPNKAGACMVQMADSRSAGLALNCLDKAHLFNVDLDLKMSIHPYIAAGRQDQQNTENPTCISYAQSPLNRFSNSSPKHTYRPTRVLYFANVAEDMSEVGMQEVFTAAGIATAPEVKFFDAVPGRVVAKPKKTGLLQFADEHDAAAACVMCNNEVYHGCTLKLSFSKNSFGPEDPRLQNPESQQGAPAQ